MTKNKTSNKDRIKWFTIVKEDILDELKKGNKDKGLQNISIFLSGVKKDMVSRKKTDDQYPFYNLLLNLQTLLTRDALIRGKLNEIIGKDIPDEEVKALIAKLESKVVELDHKQLDDYVNTVVENINTIVNVLNEIEKYRKDPTMQEESLFDAEKVN